MKFTLLSAFFISLASSTLHAANLLVDGGFENAITTDGPPFVGLWEGFAGGGATSANATTGARTGSGALQLNVVNTANTFTGAFQDVVISPGVEYTYSGWQKSPNAAVLGIEIRIEWRSATGEVGRTANLMPALTPDYTAFTFKATAPAGATVARVVYAAQTFSTAPAGNGTALADDLSFTAVPEPSAVAFLGLACLGMVRRRR